MKERTISAVVTEIKDKESGEVVFPETAASVVVQFPETLQEFVDAYKEPVVLSKVIGKVTIDLQSYIRGLIKAGKDDNEIQKKAAAWKPGMTKPGKSKVEKVGNFIDDASDKELESMLAKMKARKQTLNSGK